MTKPHAPAADAAHGRRSTYQTTGCRCLRCRAAEATYRAQLRRLHLTGRRVLGALVPAWQTKRYIRALESEGFHKDEIAQWALGVPRLRLTSRRIRLSTAVKVERFYRAEMRVEGELSNADWPIPDGSP